MVDVNHCCPICGVDREEGMYFFKNHKCNPKVLAGLNGAQTRGNNDKYMTNLHENVFHISISQGSKIHAMAGDI